MRAANNGDAVVMDERARNWLTINTVVATILLTVAVSMWLPRVIAAEEQPKPDPRIKPLSIAPALLWVGQHLCRNNGGLREIRTKYPFDDRYNFFCGDGAMFIDSFIRVKKDDEDGAARG
jgi:hypothetical protein